MQTFLPYTSFIASAMCLDRARLGKQRVECMQLLHALLNPGTSRWENHPAAKMWKGHEGCLAAYGIAVCQEWIRRGYKDTCLDKITEMSNSISSRRSYDVPPWLGDGRLHSSHRSNLLRKNPEHYAKHGWIEGDNLPYWWPVK